MNIYLTHTFVFAYYWRDLVVSQEHKLLYFLAVLGVCLAFSVSLEWVKQKTNYNKLAERFISIIERKMEGNRIAIQ